MAQARRDAKEAGKAFAVACAGNDVHALLVAVDRLNNWTSGGWPIAFRSVVRSIDNPLSLKMRRAFLEVWIENKSIAMDFDQHFLHRHRHLMQSAHELPNA